MAEVTIIVKTQGKTMTFEYDDVEIKQERGINTIYRSGLLAPVDIKPNGHQRMVIRAWKGCKTFEAFKADQTTTLPPKRINVTDKAKRINVTDKPKRRLDPEKVAKALGAVPADSPVRGNSLVPPYRKGKRP